MGVFTYVQVFTVLNRFVDLFCLLMGWSFEYLIVTIVTFFSGRNFGSLPVLKTPRESAKAKPRYPAPHLIRYDGELIQNVDAKTTPFCCRGVLNMHKYVAQRTCILVLTERTRTNHPKTTGGGMGLLESRLKPLPSRSPVKY